MFVVVVKISERSKVVSRKMLQTDESTSKGSKCMLFKYLPKVKELLRILRSYFKEIVFVYKRMNRTNIW